MAFRDLAGRALSVCVRTFGEELTYTPSAGGPAQIRGIWDWRHEAIDPDTGAVVSSNQVTAGVVLADLPAAPQPGDTITRQGVVYRLSDPPQEDGQGGAVLFMHRE